jgi:DNA-directed RNA polymerase subunit E'/Rpb7
MDNHDIFVRTLLLDKVKIKPMFISANIKEHILTHLRSKFEGICSHHGYIKPHSIDIFKYSLGYIQALSLNGDVEYTVNYYADVCNPSVGSIVFTQIVNTNKLFGALAQTGYKNDQTFVPILEIVIPKKMVNTQHDQNVDDFKIGDQLHVEILGKKFELSDKKICAIGRIVNTNNDQNILDNEDIDRNSNDDVDEQNTETDTDEESQESEKSEEYSEKSSEDEEDDESQGIDDDVESDGFYSDGGDEASDFD